MDIKQVFSVLLPDFEAINLKNGLNSNCDSIDEMLPQYENLQELVGTFQGKPFNSKSVQEISDNLVDSWVSSGLTVKGVRRASVLEYIIGSMKNVAIIKGFVEQSIDRDIGRGIQTSALTFSKQTILQLLDVIDFFTGYSALFLNYVTAEEISSVEGSNIEVRGIGPNDESKLRTQLPIYAIAVRILATPMNKLKADYADIPEAVFTEDTYADLVSSFGTGKVDPLGMASVPFPLSIILRVRLNMAQWQMDKYDECVAAAKAAELRILLYKKQLAEKGTGDAAIERLIEFHEKKLMELKYKREKLEKKYNLKNGE